MKQIPKADDDIVARHSRRLLMPDRHKHWPDSSEHRPSSGHGQQWHEQSSSRSASSSQDGVALQGLAAQHRNLRRMDKARHAAIFHTLPRAVRKQYNKELRRRGDRLADQCGQIQDQLAQERALAQGPFAPGEVYEYLHLSRWTAVAENKQPTDVSWSKWAQGLREEEKLDPGQAGGKSGNKKQSHHGSSRH